MVKYNCWGDDRSPVKLLLYHYPQIITIILQRRFLSVDSNPKISSFAQIIMMKWPGKIFIIVLRDQNFNSGRFCPPKPK